jgi:peptidyl-prolyl cis-trans isomerase SurA
MEKKSPAEYLEMYINFKLKVVEALNLKMDTVTAFRKELAGYRTDLAAPYLTDIQYDEALIKELYNRMKKEINASHILFRINADAGKEEEQSVLQKAEKVKQEILIGKDFNQAAIEYSEDPSAKSNKGMLGYFSAFQMVTPFENVAFNIPVGEVSEPVRTAFGYHLIKVHDVRENRGEIKVAHIMKMFPREGEFNKAEVKAEIDAVYEQLIKDASFEEMVKQHSDDKHSAAEKGEMPWFSSNRMIPEFAEPAFNLKNDGDYTPPVETPYGYHIIKKIGHRPVPSFDEMRANIEERIKKDPERSNSTRKVFIEKLKKEYGFYESIEEIAKINNVGVEKDFNENPLLFTIDNNKFHLNNFKQYLLKENINAGTFSDYYPSWTEYEMVQLEDSRLEEKYPDFRYLVQEYHDGLLFFNIMEDKIWKFAAEDSIGLETFYSKNKSMFLWEERFKGLIITCKNKEAREESEKYFDAQLTPEEVEDLLNKEDKLIEIKRGAWEKGDNQVVDHYVWNEQSTSGFNPELTFIRGNVIDSEPKTLEEAKGLYISAYQDYIEKTWIKSLRKKYKIKVNKKLLKTVPHV